MEQKITWLHLSDIHFSKSTEWRDELPRTELISYLKRLLESSAIEKPDLIFCTGDIAFGETSSSKLSDQYLLAETFFNTLLEACKLSKDRLFLVPGNHDINRKNINSDAQHALVLLSQNCRNHVDEINNRIEKRTKEFIDAAHRLDEYNKFISNYLPHQHDPEGRTVYNTLVDVNGKKIGISGFNSAWTCAGHEDDRNIWLGARWQFNKNEKETQNADIRIGLIHHPTDWFNTTEREEMTRRIASGFDFWLHGHSHNAWVTPVQSHIAIAAGAIGAAASDEFGFNITTLHLEKNQGATLLNTKRNSDSGWTIAPIDRHAPMGTWNFTLPARISKQAEPTSKEIKPAEEINSKEETTPDHIELFLENRLNEALKSFSSQPRVWVNRLIYKKPEFSIDAKEECHIEIEEIINTPSNLIITAPPQYGLTCLGHFLILSAWRAKKKSLWAYLDARYLKPNNASVSEAINSQITLLGKNLEDIKCVILDSWSPDESDGVKLLKRIHTIFKDIPIICLRASNGVNYPSTDDLKIDRQFDALFLWALPRESIRKIVTEYNETHPIGEDNAVTKRLLSDLEVLNLHRTPLNCLTLLKVAEAEFDESPVNRSEMIKRVLFLLFNADQLPTYHSKPDLKDCEFVLGYFCEQLVREGNDLFTRDRFLKDINLFCQANLIDLETNVVFDVLYTNNILVKHGHNFYFKFAYWIFYFVAQRMNHDPVFLNYILSERRYSQYPEIIEFYTGNDRMRDNAIDVIIKDLRACREVIKEKCGLPQELNPYRFGKWSASKEAEEKMHQEVANGVKESNLPDAIKDQFADRAYDVCRPYNQSINQLLTEDSFLSFIKLTTAASRALRNSDYVSAAKKRELLAEILKCWDQKTKVLFLTVPKLAEEGYAVYDQAGFLLVGEFGKTKEERMLRIFTALPYNVAIMNQDDLFSTKMGPLLFDQLERKEISEISRHELILLLILQRPRDWVKHVKKYIANCQENSFYLLDIANTLKNQYRYAFASKQTLSEIENLIRIAYAKHLTGSKDPGKRVIEKMLTKIDPVPKREV